LKNDAAEEQISRLDPAIVAWLKPAIENGMAPAKVADIVFNAIKEKKFYILPNAEMLKPMIQARMEDILQERNPTTLS
jgi:hypothetical protein